MINIMKKGMECVLVLMNREIVEKEGWILWGY